MAIQVTDMTKLSNAIDGKYFSNSYFFQVVFSNRDYVYLAANEYSGLIIQYIQANISGTIQVTDAVYGKFTMNGASYKILGASADGNSLIFNSYDAVRNPESINYILSGNGTYPPGTRIYQSPPLVNGILYFSSATFITPGSACFVTGTMISTANGPMAVEDLRMGDFVLLANGGAKPVKWIGHRHVRCRGTPFADAIAPVCVRRGAVARDVPCRDLLVSPEHAIGFPVNSEVMIRAGALVNGSTIVREPMESVTYWHVELEEYAMIIANGVSVESYLDTGNRSYFANTDGPTDISPHNIGNAPPTVDEGTVLNTKRDRLAVQATRLGWTQCKRSARVQLEIDGETLDPLFTSDRQIEFKFFSSAESVVLLSDTHVPGLLDGSRSDMRTVGIIVYRLTFHLDGGVKRVITMNDPDLTWGWHRLEQVGDTDTRWTDGHTPLPYRSEPATDTQVRLTIDYMPTTHAFWTQKEVAAPLASEARTATHQ